MSGQGASPEPTQANGTKPVAEHDQRGSQNIFQIMRELAWAAQQYPDPPARTRAVDIGRRVHKPIVWNLDADAADGGVISHAGSDTI